MRRDGLVLPKFDHPIWCAILSNGKAMAQVCDQAVSVSVDAAQHESVM